MNELNVKIEKELLYKYKAWENILKYNQIYPLNNICFVSQKPLEINKNENGLHSDNKAAIIYAGGLEFYYLNGVNVPKWLAVTPKDKIDINKYHEIENVEIKQEFIKKVGLENLLNELNYDLTEKINAQDLYKNNSITTYLQHGDKIIEPENEKSIQYKDLKRTFKTRLKEINYKLIRLEVEGEKHNYLYMDNVSIEGEGHIEGVSDDCKSVYDAICWRNQKQSLPCMLT